MGLGTRTYKQKGFGLTGRRNPQRPRHEAFGSHDGSKGRPWGAHAFGPDLIQPRSETSARHQDPESPQSLVSLALSLRSLNPEVLRNNEIQTQIHLGVHPHERAQLVKMASYYSCKDQLRTCPVSTPSPVEIL